MQNYTQTDPRWKNLTYDGVNTFGKTGCLVVSLANLSDKSPIDVASILKNNNLFTNGYINDSAKAAQVLGLEYNGVSQNKPDYDTIAETNYYSPGQHFFIVKVDGSIIDPLGLHSSYPIVNYRLFKSKGDIMLYDLFSTPDGAVYERLNNYALVHIPSPDFAVKYYGSDWLSKVTKVDDI